MIAVDSPVLVELLSNGPQADAVEAILRQSLVGGRVVVCGATLAEVCACAAAPRCSKRWKKWAHFNPMERRCAPRDARHRQRGSRRSLDEFMVGAHALLQCDGLITWNDTFYRDYFKGLKLIVPHA